MKSVDILIIGGGPAGFFTAINAAKNIPKAKIIILEKGKEVLGKVKVSGGGRCNITYAEYDPKVFTQFYPRGQKELLGPFYNFMSGDLIAWFEQRGVAFKTEKDGRIFPVSDSSQTIINCLLDQVNQLNIKVYKGCGVNKITKEDTQWHVETKQGSFKTKKLVIATGSSIKTWRLLKELGHSIVSPVPSLFTFNINDSRIKDLPGVSTEASVEVINQKLKAQGPLLITHWGMSGPAVLKLSAWGARSLNTLNYSFSIKINWTGTMTNQEVIEQLLAIKLKNAKQNIIKYPRLGIPKRLWQNLAKASGVSPQSSWAELTKKTLLILAEQLSSGIFHVEGKSTFKEEFVTAGGIELKEVNFKTFESKLNKNLYFAGEVLNIDALTGGFNFQNAWTGAYIVANAITL